MLPKEHDSKQNVRIGPGPIWTKCDPFSIWSNEAHPPYWGSLWTKAFKLEIVLCQPETNSFPKVSFRTEPQESSRTIISCDCVDVEDSYRANLTQQPWKLWLWFPREYPNGAAWLPVPVRSPKSKFQPKLCYHVDPRQNMKDRYSPKIPFATTTSPNCFEAQMITQMIRKRFFCVTDVHVIWKLIPRQFMCVIGAFTESTLWRRPNKTKNSCQKALCNRCPLLSKKSIPKY